MRIAFVTLVSACAASVPSRMVVTAKAEFHEAEPAAQPAPVAATAVPASSGTPDKLADSKGPVVFGLLDGEAALEDAWDRWNAGKTGSYDEVFEIAVLANRARPLAMSDELMVVALVRAVELSECEPERLGRIRLLAIAVNGSAHVKELDGDLARLADTGPSECKKAAP